MPASAQAADLHLKKEDLGAPLYDATFFNIYCMKTATTIVEQINRLKQRGIIIPDEAKAKEI